MLSFALKLHFVAEKTAEQEGTKNAIEKRVVR